MNMQDDSEKMLISPAIVESALNLNSRAKEELARVSLLEFNIFNLQTQTSNNGLVVTTCYILAKQNLFSSLNVSFDVFVAFMARIQKGYKDITYHNSTHAADLC